MADGVVQWIRLLLDKGSVAQAKADANTAGKQIGDAVAEPMNAAGSKGATNYGDGFKGAVLKAFDRIRDTINGVLQPAIAQAKTSGAEAGAGFSSGFMGAVRKLAGALGIALGARALVRFAEESVHALSDYQAALNQTAQTLANLGIRYDDVREHITALQNSMTGAIGPTEWQNVFNKLLLVTRNYAVALRLVPVSVDLMVASHRDAQYSAQMLGRAIEGSTGGLTRWGIVIDKTRPVLEQLTQIHDQFLAKQQGVAGTLQQVSSAWEAFQITVGQVLMTMGGGTNTANTLVAVIRTMTQWLRENAESFRSLGTVARAAFFVLVSFGDVLGTVARGAQAMAAILTLAGASAQNAFKLAGSAAADMAADIAGALGRIVPRFAGMATALRAEARKLYDDATADQKAAVAAAQKTLADLQKPHDKLGPVQVIHPAPGDGATGVPGMKPDKDTTLSHEIELLGKGLLLDDQRAASAKKLDELQAAINAKLKQHGLSLEQEIALQDHLKEIEKARETPDTALAAEIGSLRDRLQLNTDDESARTRLVAIQTELLKRQQDTTKSATEQYEVNKLLIAVNGALNKDAIGPLLQQAQLLHEEVQYQETRNQALADGADLLVRVNAMLAAGNLAVADQVALLRIRNELQKDASTPAKELEKEAGTLISNVENARSIKERDDALAALQRLNQQLAALAKDSHGDADEVARITQARDKVQKTLDAHPLQTKTFMKDFVDTMKALGTTMADTAAGGIVDSFENAFERLIRGSGDVRASIAGMFGGMASGLAKELGDVAKMKSKENLAYSIEETAIGIGDMLTNQTGAAVAFKSAATHLAAAAAWGTLGGAAGGVAGGAPGGGAGYGGSQSGNVGGNTAAKMSPAGPQIVLHIDGIDPKNPRHQELAGLTIAQYTQRAGATFVLGGK